MPKAARHSKPKTPGIRFGVPVVAAVALVGAAAAFVFLHPGSAAPAAVQDKISITGDVSGPASDETTADVRHVVAARMVRASAAAIRQKYLATLAATRLAQQKAAQQRAAEQASQQATQQASTSPGPAPTLSSGGNAAQSALGVCIRNREEGGSYAWGPGNGGGAYQFQLGTWEKYGGAASEYGVAGPAYQDQIFDNAIAAGGASNWTAYDGC